MTYPIATILGFRILGLPLAQDAGPGGLPFPLIAALLFGLFYFMIIRPESKKQRSRRDLIANLKKNDRVVTVGGIYGVIANVQKDAGEVTVKVDEATNTKLRLTFAAIERVLTDETNDGESGKK